MMKTFALSLVGLGLAGAALAQGAPPAQAPVQTAGPAAAEGTGVVRALNAKAGTITLDHDAIPSLGWPAMTMTFKAADPALLRGVAPGQRVRFQLKGQVVVSVSPG